MEIIDKKVVDFDKVCIYYIWLVCKYLLIFMYLFWVNFIVIFKEKKDKVLE